MVGSSRRRRFETATRHSFTVAPSSLPPPHKSLLLLFPKASHVIPLWRTDTTKERLRQQLLLLLLLLPPKVSQPDVVGVAPSPPPQPTPPPPPPPSSFLPRYSFGFVRWAPLVCMFEGERKGRGAAADRSAIGMGAAQKKLREATPAHATNPKKRGRGENERSVRGGERGRDGARCQKGTQVGRSPLPLQGSSSSLFSPSLLPLPLSILILLLLLPTYVGRYSNCMCCCLATTSNKGSDVSSEGDSRIRLNSSLSENLLPCSGCVRSTDEFR